MLYSVRIRYFFKGTLKWQIKFFITILRVCSNIKNVAKCSYSPIEGPSVVSFFRRRLFLNVENFAENYVRNPIAIAHPHRRNTRKSNVNDLPKKQHLGFFLKKNLVINTVEQRCSGRYAHRSLLIKTYTVFLHKLVEEQI